MTSHEAQQQPTLADRTPTQRTYVEWTSEVYLMPAMLADFECAHGKIGPCRSCDQQSELVEPTS